MHKKNGYSFKTGQVFTKKKMKRMKEKIQLSILFIVIKNLLCLYSQVPHLKRVTKKTIAISHPDRFMHIMIDDA